MQESRSAEPATSVFRRPEIAWPTGPGGDAVDGRRSPRATSGRSLGARGRSRRCTRLRLSPSVPLGTHSLGEDDEATSSGGEDLFENGDDLGTDSATQEAHVAIAGIVDRGQVERGAVGLDVRPPEPQERTGEQPFPRCHRRQGTWRCSAESSHEDGLRLIVGGVTQGDGGSAEVLGEAAQRGVSGPPGTVLEGRPVADVDV